MKKICYSLLFFLATNSFAQNLVINPSFEEGAQCDGSTERINTIDNWTPIAGNPGYLSTKCPLSKDSKSYIIGMKLPPALKEKVLSVQKIGLKSDVQQSKLSQPLEEGKKYVVSMWVRLPIMFGNAPINEVGVLLSNEALPATEERRLIDLPALALKNNTQTPIKKQYEWEAVSAIYTAKGGEQFIAIGNFNNTNQGVFEERSPKESTYIFIDAVSVKEFVTIDLPAYTAEMPIKQNERLLLPSIEFEPSSDLLKSTSHQILDQLAERLKENITMKVEIAGYTDNSLDETESLEFSKARAKAIVRYLTSQGVPEKQLVAVGRGSANAIALNNTVQNRKKNERIELKFLTL